MFPSTAPNHRRLRRNRGAPRAFVDEPPPMESRHAQIRQVLRSLQAGPQGASPRPAGL